MLVISKGIGKKMHKDGPGGKKSEETYKQK
jgi:hypothetical protein